MTATFGRRNAVAAQPIMAPRAAVNPWSDAQQGAMQTGALATRSAPDYARGLDAARAAEDILGIGLRGPGGDAQEEVDMMRSIGGSWASYRAIWEKMRDGDSMPVSFSAAAFFFTTLWLLYRKLYAYAFMVLAANMALLYITASNVRFLSFGVAIFFGAFGKALVVKRSMDLVAMVNHLPMSREERARKIEKSGGVSIIAVVAFLVVIALIFMVFLVAGTALAVSSKHH
jgi:hypothetical protein